MYTDMRVYAEGAHDFDASKELIMLRSYMCPFSNIARYIAKGAHIFRAENKHAKGAHVCR